MSDGSTVSAIVYQKKTKRKLSGDAMMLFGTFGGFIFGYETGVFSGVQTMGAWLKQFGKPSTDLVNNPTGYYLPSSNDTLITTILLAGTFIGALLVAPIADKFGRRWGILASTLAFTIGVALQTAAKSIPLFAAGRFFGGLGVGSNSCIVPVFLSECSPKSYRGAVIGGYQWAITIGLLLASVITNSTQNRTDSSAYLIPISLKFIWAMIMASGTFWIPESPRWLMKVGRRKDAADAMSRFTGQFASSSEIKNELDEIAAHLDSTRALGLNSYLDCFRWSKNKMRLRTLTGILIQVFQQLTGINFIFYYGISFFKNSGIRDPFIISIVTNAVNVVMTLPGIYGVERFGRRRLLFIGSMGMSLCEYIVAIVGETISVKDLAGQQVLIVFVCIFISFFAATWGPITWLMTSEIYPLDLRAKAMSISTSANWLSNFAISYSLPYLVDSKPGSAGLQSKVFFIWGSTCFCGIIFTFLFIPETQGLSLEQIDSMYQAVTPIRSLEYRRNMRPDNDNFVLHVRPSDQWESKTP